MKKKLKAIDFFSGAGGLTYGLQAAGIKVLAGIDNDSTCKETFETNNQSAVFIEKDITKYSPQELERELHIQKNDNFMVFAGCAPCQFWSIIQTSREKSKKTKNLILEFQRFIEYFNPGFVVVENVPGISSKKGSPVGRFISALEALGYNVAHEVTDMSLYGIPQKRRRFTLLASRTTPISLPKPSNKKTTVRDVLGVGNGFSKIKAGTIDPTNFLHTAASLNRINTERIKMITEDGGDRSVWQNKTKYQLACYASNGKKFYDTYGRMWWDRPSPTITTKFFSISNGRFAHPEEHRAISLREGATLQTFPKDYKFFGNSITSIAKMIGNAVPPEFAKIIGGQIIKAANNV